MRFRSKSVVVALLVLGVTSCGGDPSEQSTADAPSPSETSSAEASSPEWLMAFSGATGDEGSSSERPGVFATYSPAEDQISLLSPSGPQVSVEFSSDAPLSVSGDNQFVLSELSIPKDLVSGGQYPVYRVDDQSATVVQWMNIDGYSSEDELVRASFDLSKESQLLLLIDRSSGERQLWSFDVADPDADPQLLQSGISEDASFIDPMAVSAVPDRYGVETTVSGSDLPVTFPFGSLSEDQGGDDTIIVTDLEGVQWRFSWVGGSDSPMLVTVSTRDSDSSPWKNGQSLQLPGAADLLFVKPPIDE